MFHALSATQPWWPHLFNWPRWLDPVSWWWLSTKGYALTSSWFNVAWLGILVVFYRHHTCHIHRCWRLQWHPDPVTGHPICKKHHPHDPRTLR